MVTINNLLNETVELQLNNSTEQDGFLQSTFGKIIDFSIDTGIRALLPDVIENEVIDVKNAIIKEGFPGGVKSLINNVINIGKNAMGMITGNFDKISQVEKAFEKGGIIGSISNMIDQALNKINNKESISENTVSTIQNGKDVILDNVSTNIKKELETQNKQINNLTSYIDKWVESFENKNMKDMEKNIKKIKTSLEKIMPIESLIKNARAIENLHELIKKRENDFSLSKDELELANLLI